VAGPSAWADVAMQTHEPPLPPRDYAPDLADGKRRQGRAELTWAAAVDDGGGSRRRWVGAVQG
jgi:hypothetical protein